MTPSKHFFLACETFQYFPGIIRTRNKTAVQWVIPHRHLGKGKLKRKEGKLTATTTI